MRAKFVLAALLGALGAGCQSLSPGDPAGVDQPPTSNEPLVDSRPVINARVSPLPITGGTLLALRDARHVLVSDPDRGRVLLVDVLAGAVRGQIAVGEAAQPWRAIEGKDGQAYVVLRGTGEVLTVDTVAAAAGERRRACAMPRGIALAPGGDGLVIACAEGKLVELPLAGAGVARETAIAQDVRDVVVTQGKLVVSRFRSAELLELDENRAQKAVRRMPETSSSLRFDPLRGSQSGMFEPAVAWRTVAHPNDNGGMVVVHQRATVEAIAIDEHGEGEVDAPTVGEGSYGGGVGGVDDGCGGIVQSAVSLVKGDRIVSSAQLAGVVLPVDVAVSSSGQIAVASAGARDPSAPRNLNTSGVQPGSIALLSLVDIEQGASLGCFASTLGSVQEQVLAVAFVPKPAGEPSTLVAQTRDPAELVVIDSVEFGSEPRRIALSGEARTDTGHDIFHRDAGSGIACASCHVEGTDDGRVWHFDPIGARRTQPIDVNLRGTEPFHWDGTLPTMDRLMNEVFTARMGGPRESSPRVGALSEWIFQLPPRAPLRATMDASAQRGKALFESSDVGCATCHGGPGFTNNQTVDVGTGVELQVPSLLGVSQRLPVMHNGCAHTLRERFDAWCGGNAHGDVSGLAEDQIADLVAYLEAI